MSGILGRFKTIMEANVNALLDKAENPVKMAEQLARDLEDDLGRVKAETASVMAEVKRAQRAYDECAETVEKLQKYAEAAVLKGNDVDAKAFLMEKAEKSKTLEGLAGALDVADKMRQLHDQLESQLRQINERKAAIRAKAAMADAKERTAELGRSIGGAAENLSAFDRLEEKIDRRLDEAEAMAELNARRSGVEDLMAKYDAPEGGALDDELAVLKAKLGK